MVTGRMLCGHSEKPRSCRMLMAVSCVLRADNKAELTREKPSLDHSTVVLVTYVNINTPTYLKCSLVMVLVIYTIG